jgi:hypothetical protein
MNVSIDQFHQNLVHVRNLAAIHAELRQNNSRLELSDILRAELVLAVSALDTFIHDLVCLGMVEVLRGQRRQTKSYQEFKVSMKVVSFDSTYNWFEAEIRRRHGEESYQRPDKIADALKFISDISLWEKVANKVNQPVDDVKNQLKEIVKRRNSIVHESDLDPTTPGRRLDIDDVYVDEVINFIEKLGEAIYKVVV